MEGEHLQLKCPCCKLITQFYLEYVKRKGERVRVYVCVVCGNKYTAQELKQS